MISIGLFKASLSWLAKPVVNSTYFSSGLHVKHVVARSAVLALPLLMSIAAVPSDAVAGNLKAGWDHAVASKFWNWNYAQKVWVEMNTTAKIDAEFAKCSAEFDPWLARYKQDARRAMDEIDKMPKEKQRKVKQCYDIQLAWDHWFDHVYSTWYNGYAQDYLYKRAKTPSFDDWLADFSRRNTCHQEVMLDECGPVPDWRSARMHSESQAMMAEAQREAAEADAKRQKMFSRPKK